MAVAQQHPALDAIAFLIGTWRGEGRGHYPTIEDFTYGEEARFWHVGRPVLMYAQRTWSLETEAPMHSEMGFWRPQRDGSLELVLAHGFGIAGLALGTVEANAVEVRSTSLVSTGSAKQVDALARRYRVEGDVLRYEIDMAYGGAPLQGHLVAELTRVE